MAVLIRVDDPADPRIALFRATDRALNTRSHRRDALAGTPADGMFLAEGDLVVERALHAGCTPLMAFVDIDAPPPVTDRLGDGVPVYAGDADVRRVGMGLAVPLSIVAVFRRPAPMPADTVVAERRVVALDGVDNPVNVGTVVRSAVALGWRGLLLDRSSADPLARRALRVSMGNAFALPWARAESLATTVLAAREAGALVVALTPGEGAMPLEAVLPGVGQRVMLMLGSERTGISPEVLAACSLRACIPMAVGVDSMNAAAAAAVACYALRPTLRR